MTDSPTTLCDNLPEFRQPVRETCASADSGGLRRLESCARVRVGVVRLSVHCHIGANVGILDAAGVWVGGCGCVEWVGVVVVVVVHFNCRAELDLCAQWVFYWSRLRFGTNSARFVHTSLAVRHFVSDCRHSSISPIGLVYVFACVSFRVVFLVPFAFQYVRVCVCVSVYQKLHSNMSVAVYVCFYNIDFESRFTMKDGHLLCVFYHHLIEFIREEIYNNIFILCYVVSLCVCVQ